MNAVEHANIIVWIDKYYRTRAFDGHGSSPKFSHFLYPKDQIVTHAAKT